MNSPRPRAQTNLLVAILPADTMAETTRVVLRNANLIAGSAPPQPNATVVIEGNRIARGRTGARPAIARSTSPARR
jgi:hypothetical protein